MSIEMAPFRSLSKALKASFKTESVRKRVNETNVLTQKVARLTFQLVLVQFCFLKEKSLSRQLFLNAAVKASQLWVSRSCRRFFSTESLTLVSKCGNISTHRPKLLFWWLFTRQRARRNFCHFWLFFSNIKISTRWFFWCYDTVDTRRLWKWAERMSQSAEQLVRNA